MLEFYFSPVRLDVVTAVAIKIYFFWNVTSCSLVEIKTGFRQICSAIAVGG